MKIPEMNKVYVLNPHYHLRHDIHRVALFSSTGTDTDCSRNWHTFIHPLQAVMLSFFTYDRPLQTTLPLLCDFFCRSKEEMIKWGSDFIDNPTPIYTSSQQGEIYVPKRILIEAERQAKHCVLTGCKQILLSGKNWILLQEGCIPVRCSSHSC